MTIATGTPTNLAADIRRGANQAYAWHRRIERAADALAAERGGVSASPTLLRIAEDTVRGKAHAEALTEDERRTRRTSPVGGMALRGPELVAMDEDAAFYLRNRVTDPATRTTADALRDTGNHHQGTRVHGANDAHLRDMRRSGLVGPRGGLTRRGSIAAERLRSDALDDAFGPL